MPKRGEDQPAASDGWALLLSDPEAAHRCQRASGLVLNEADRPGMSAAVRLSFVGRSDGGGEPPLLPLIRAATKGGTSLRLQLALLWIAAVRDLGAEAIVTERSDVLAALAGVPTDPTGRRRLDHATRSLQDLGLLRIDSAGRGLRRVRLHSEGRASAGTGGAVVSARHERPRGPRGTLDDRYLQIPQGFWTQGWAAVLPSSAVAVYLALLFVRGTAAESSDSGRIFLSDSLRERRFGFSEDLFYEGRSQLERFGLIQLHWAPVNPPFDDGRTRGECELREWVLSTDVTDARVRRRAGRRR